MHNTTISEEGVLPNINAALLTGNGKKRGDDAAQKL